MFNANQALAGDYQTTELTELFQAICHQYGVDEQSYIQQLMPLLELNEQQLQRVTQTAEEQVTKIRAQSNKGLELGIDAFLQQYSLNTHEGIVLMCLAEALLRIPDSDTVDELIEAKLTGAQWDKYLAKSDSFLVNASTWGLMLTGQLIAPTPSLSRPKQIFQQMIGKLGEPLIRTAMYSAMKVMAKQFVLGRNIKEALKNSAPMLKKGYSYSYDMLGEAAIRQADADKYFAEYSAAIEVLGRKDHALPDEQRPSISIKLSALHPRYEFAKQQRVLNELFQRVEQLIEQARALNVGLTIDAEEADRLELSLQLFEKLYRSPVSQGWGQLGLVVQAYSKRALPILVWLNQLSQIQGDIIPVRLVKGAYWDSEIKWSQIRGEQGFPVFTRKASTDVSYLVCARYLLEQTQGQIYPQFATHNVQTLANILVYSDQHSHFECQRLHGMGEALYNNYLTDNPHAHVRIYAPVGAHKELLPYLVRRLLENGANTSFVHQLTDPKVPIASLTIHPLIKLHRYDTLADHRIALAEDLFYPHRQNSYGENLNRLEDYQPLVDRLKAFDHQQWQATPLIDGQPITTAQASPQSITAPFHRQLKVGELIYANAEDYQAAISSALAAFPQWRDSHVSVRAQALFTLADLLESNRYELIALCSLEAGKTLQDGIDEVREAVDFCRYYANLAMEHQSQAREMSGPTGENNSLYLQGRGVFACISPWNFPLAIFLGQITAALVTGNCVLAKPAEQTSLIAYRAIELAHQAGIPTQVLQFLPGTGKEIGGLISQDPRIAGICFTGSTQTAKLINLQLAQRAGAIAPLIAETGGQNAMLVDSTALPEQVILDVIQSAFASAGQRCSALRVLYLQQDIAEDLIKLLKGAMAELTLGDPRDYATDVGPVIDQQAQQKLLEHIELMKQQGKLIYQTPLPSLPHAVANTSAQAMGYFVPPTAIEIESITQLTEEQFGPILHIVRYQRKELPQVIEAINNTGYGLTFGIHSRNEQLALKIASKLNVGNVYINRNQIGAVVGVQPFGGQGLSGTGPKAGGPNYLHRFMTEKTISNNITAIGGNTTLLGLDSD